MAQEFIAGYFTPLERPSRPDRPPLPPITIPPLPPGWGKPPVEPPVQPDPGADIEQPIYIPAPPSWPPGVPFPPFNPGDGLSGKVLLVCWVPGTGKFKWICVDVPELPGLPPGWPDNPPARPQPTPPEATPKGR